MPPTVAELEVEAPGVMLSMPMIMTRERISRARAVFFSGSLLF